jgi:mono/diheme cytochrome c family protein
LVGGRETLAGLVAGVLGLILLSLVLGVVMPGIPDPGNGVRSSAIGFSEPAQKGRQIYLQQGCGSCHTQMVRNVVPDVGLGPVTLADTNQVIGYRRYGPDLAAIGDRTADQAVLLGILRGAAGHPAVSALNDDELANLTAYLLESR